MILILILVIRYWNNCGTDVGNNSLGNKFGYHFGNNLRDHGGSEFGNHMGDKFSNNVDNGLVISFDNSIGIKFGNMFGSICLVHLLVIIAVILCATSWVDDNFC